MRARALGAAAAGALLAGALAEPAAAQLGFSTATPAVFGTALAPGTTISSTGGTVIVTSVLGLTGWNLRVEDDVNGGFLKATGGTCTGSKSPLGQALKIVASGPGSSSLSYAAKQTVTGSPKTIATYSALVTLLSSVTLSTTLEQTVNANETLRAGCLYTTTLTYTLQ